MTADDALRQALEDFTARLLAVEASDDDGISQLHRSLDTMLESVEAPQQVQLLQLCCKALKELPNQKHSQPGRILEAVAGAAAAVVAEMNGDQGEHTKTAHTCLSKMLQQLQTPEDSDRQATAALAPSPANAAAGLEADTELVKDFIAESCDRIAAAEAALLALEAAPQHKEHIDTVLRAFHTVKGTAGFLGLQKIQDLAHLAESLLILARDGKLALSAEHIDMSLASCDALRSMITSLETSASSAAIEPAKVACLVERLRKIHESAGSTPAQSGSAARIPSPPQAQPVQASNVSKLYEQRLDESVRVNAQRLDELVNMVGELVIAHSIIAQSTASSELADQPLSRSVSHAGKILRSLQDLSLCLRMVPLRNTFARMARLVRDLSRKSGKQLQLVTTGQDTEIDRNMVEVLGDPLVHMIRNAVDHGIESSCERTQRGKNPRGTISLRAYHSAGNVVIELHDDGKGLDRDRILQHAIDRGLVKSDQQLSDSEIYSMIFLPGFSTAGEVTEVSGRGVGMDVVKRNVDSLRGKIEVQSEAGVGTTFTLRLPLTLAIVDAMLLSVGSERFLLPTIAIQHSLQPTRDMIFSVTGRGEMIRVREQLVPLVRLARLFNVSNAQQDPSKALCVIIDAGASRCALMVDQLQGQQQVVIKPLSKLLSATSGLSGAAIMGDGRVGLILDAPALVQLAQGRSKAA